MHAASSFPGGHTDPISDGFACVLDHLLCGGGLDIEGSLKEKQGSMSFENFIKCLKDMSYSSLFTQENSKKFHFKTVAEQVDDNIARGADSQSAPSFPG